MSADQNTHEPPRAFLCPITYEAIVDPVVAADGHTYEREAIDHWFNLHQINPRSPITNERLANRNLYPNHSLRSQIAQWREDNGLPAVEVPTRPVVEVPTPPVVERISAPPTSPFHSPPTSQFTIRALLLPDDPRNNNTTIADLDRRLDQMMIGQNNDDDELIELLSNLNFRNNNTTEVRHNNQVRHNPSDGVFVRMFFHPRRFQRIHADDHKDYKVKDLKTILRFFKMPVSGCKSVLLKRLECVDFPPQVLDWFPQNAALDEMQCICPLICHGLSNFIQSPLGQSIAPSYSHTRTRFFLTPQPMN